MIKVKLIMTMLCVGAVLAACSNDKEQAETSVSGEVKAIYEAKNPYIGDNSADSELLGLVVEYFDMDNAYTIELTTLDDDNMLIVHLDSNADETKIWNISAVLLALIDNCDEVRWDYDSGENLLSYYITKEDVNLNLNIKDIKNYVKSEEDLNTLINKLNNLNSD